MASGVLGRGLLRVIALALLAAGSLAHAQEQGGGQQYIVELTAGPRELASAWTQKSQLRASLQGASIREVTSFQRVLNAVVVEANEEQRQRLARMPGVKKVYRVREYKPLLDHAMNVHAAPAAWERLGGRENAGAGIKIAIIDTGIDATHPGFQDSSLAAPDGFPRARYESDLIWTNSKVIVARAYQGSSAQDMLGHGTSVAMAAAGVGHESPLGFLSGVAPKAWIGSYKVFRDSGAAPTTSIISAMEDAIADGMDVINLSLGSDAAEDPADDPLVQAVENAVQQGVIVVIAAGNAGPDPVTIGSPGTAPSGISVGNSLNERDFGGAVAFEDGRSFLAIPGDTSENRDPVAGPVRSAFEFDSTGLGCDSFPADSFSGTIAFIARGVCTFETKLNNAQQAGAIGAIIFTDAARPGAAGMSLGTATLPGVMVSYADGLLVQRAVSEGTVNATLMLVRGPVAVDPNRLDVSSSRGPSVDFSIKPDLAAVGSPLYTAAVGGRYRSVVGTSLSSPVVAGAAALIKQQHPGLTVAQYRSLIINSARRFNIAGQAVTPVRMAGTGLLDLDNMTQSTLAASPVSLSFGVSQTAGELSKELNLTNLGTATDTFLLDIETLGRPARPDLSTTVLQLEPGATGTVAVKIPDEIQVPGTVEGFVVIRSGNTGREMRVAYWQGVPYEIPQYLTVLEAPLLGMRGSQQTVVFRTMDENGIPVHHVEPHVQSETNGAEVLSVERADSISPGAYRAIVRLSFLSGTNVFTIRVGDITREVSISAL